MDGLTPLPSSKFSEGLEDGPMGRPNALHNDSFIVLQELCRVSMMSPLRLGGEIDGGALREKTLALEILCFALEHAGLSIKSSRRFYFLDHLF